jgi:hypothetical protein
MKRSDVSPIWSDASPHLSIRKISDRRQTGGRCQTHMACTTKHLVKHTHRPKRELTYSVVLAHVLSLLDLKAIRFKFDDRIKHCPIGFQSMTLETAQGD